MNEQAVTKQLARYKGIQGVSKELDENFMKHLETAWISLQENKSGEYEVEAEVIPIGKALTVVSQRNWLTMGYKPLKVGYDRPRLLYKLKRKGGLLMSNSPQEAFLQYEAYLNAKGKVLVGGLGLGIFAAMAASKEEVTEVIVVEISKDVIKLCRPRNKKIIVINADIKDFLKKCDEKFDYAYIDIHYGTGCQEYIKTVLPLKKLFKEKHPDTPIDFWAEEEMESQYDPEWEKRNGV